MLCLKLTVPVVDDEDVPEDLYSQSDLSKEDGTDTKELITSNDSDNGSDLRNWNRPLNCVQIFLGLFFASLATGGSISMVHINAVFLWDMPFIKI